MKKLFICFCLLFQLCSPTISAQTKYYCATGMDSVTYLATSHGIIVLKRNAADNLEFVSQVTEYNNQYQRAVSNGQYIAFSIGRVYIFSIEDKYVPSYSGFVDISSLIWFRPFGNYFMAIRNNNWHYVFGVRDSAEIIDSVMSTASTYTGNTAFYPEAVYPYFFAYSSLTNKIILYRFFESTGAFLLMDTLNVLEPGYMLTQMYGSKDKFFTRERKPVTGGYNIYEKTFQIADDSLILLSSIFSVKSTYFIDEIECTDSLIRFTNQFTNLNGEELTEPNGFLTAYSTLSGYRIYNTRRTGVPFYTEFYYSGQITGNQISSYRFFYDPTDVEDSLTGVKDYALGQNYPNPFNPSTSIGYSIPNGENVKLTVYDILGNEIKILVDGYRQAGNYTSEFSASGLNSGVYFYKLQAGSRVMVKKMILLK